jgi:asparagine synthase (glutamine-hydrolysing)
LVRQWRDQCFDPWFGPYDSNPRRWRAYRLFDFNQYGRDTRGLAEEIFGYGLRDPHADRRLLEFALSVPEPMYHRAGIQRWFARRVFADRLPHEILAEPRRGANNPAWFRSLDAARPQLAAEIGRLEASALASRLLDLPRLKRLMVEWPENDSEAEKRSAEYRLALARGVHVGRFIRWVEGGNA